MGFRGALHLAAYSPPFQGDFEERSRLQRSRFGEDDSLGRGGPWASESLNVANLRRWPEPIWRWLAMATRPPISRQQHGFMVVNLAKAAWRLGSSSRPGPMVPWFSISARRHGSMVVDFHLSHWASWTQGVDEEICRWKCMRNGWARRDGILFDLAAGRPSRQGAMVVGAPWNQGANMFDAPVAEKTMGRLGRTIAMVSWLAARLRP